MSTDFDVVCHRCKTRTHLGSAFSSNWSFGHGTKALAGQRAIGEWIQHHINHYDDAGIPAEGKQSVEIVNSDVELEGYKTEDNDDVVRQFREWLGLDKNGEPRREQD